MDGQEAGLISRGSDAGDRFRKAAQTVVVKNMALGGFKTLRDMSVEDYISPDQLQFVKNLGEGAFAIVEKDWYTSRQGQKILVAVKRLKPEIVANPEDLQMFAQEAALMRKLKHKNIVELVGVGELEKGADHNCYMVQEFMGGGTLQQMVVKEMLANTRKKGYSLVDALDICKQMAEGLDYLHSSRPMVIHRDLKLENVLLKEDQKVEGHYLAKLADFGLSKKVNAQFKCLQCRAASAQLPTRDSEVMEMERGYSIRLALSMDRGARGMQRTLSRNEKSMSRAKSFKAGEPPPVFTGQTGSLMYMAPEVFREEAYDEKADVFSYAMMMYQLVQYYLTIMAVSVKGTPEEIMAYASRVASGYRPPIQEGLPAGVKSLIQDCWAQDPAARPSMGEVVQRLEACLVEAQAGAPEDKGCSCTIS